MEKCDIANHKEKVISEQDIVLFSLCIVTFTVSETCSFLLAEAHIDSPDLMSVILLCDIIILNWMAHLSYNPIIAIFVAINIPKVICNNLATSYVTDLKL